MTTPRLVEVTVDNVEDACDLKVAKHQRDYVASVACSLAEAYVQHEIAWPRLIYAGKKLVGFVMAAFDPDNPTDYYRNYLWRLNIAAKHQKKGYGRFAVEAVLAEARRRDAEYVTVSWMPGKHSPGPFYQQLGFRPTGEMDDDEIVARIQL